MSDEAEVRIFELLGRPMESPYGTPIPGLEALGSEPAAPFLDGVETLSSAAARLDAGATSEERVVRRLGEPVQSDRRALELLTEARILPGERVTFEFAHRDLIIGTVGSTDGVRLPVELADHVYLTVDGDGDASITSA